MKRRMLFSVNKVCLSNIKGDNLDFHINTFCTVACYDFFYPSTTLKINKGGIANVNTFFAILTLKITDQSNRP